MQTPLQQPTPAAVQVRLLALVARPAVVAVVPVTPTQVVQPAQVPTHTSAHVVSATNYPHGHTRTYTDTHTDT